MPSYTNTTPREFRDINVRYVSVPSGVLGTDPTDWVYIDNESFQLTFGGTATDGDYVTTIDPVAAGVASISVTTTRATTPATNTDLATQHTADIDAAIADESTGLSRYLVSSSSDAAVVTVIGSPNAPPYRVTTSAPGSGTLDVAPDDEFPITYGNVGYGPNAGTHSSLEITVIPVDTDRLPLDPNGATLSITVRRMIDRRTTTEPDRPVGVASATTLTGQVVGVPVHIDAGAGRYGIALSTLGGGTITGLEGFEVWVRGINR